jgi:hypothetical protein
LFEFAEGLIRGVVYFLQNYLQTIWMIVRSPVRGPAELHRAYLRKGHQQVGGLTFLFVALLVYFWLNGDRLLGNVGLLARPELRGEIRSMIKAAPDLGGTAVWHPTLGALAATFIVDVALRLFLRWRLPDRSRRRLLVLAATEYALALPALIVVIAQLLTVTTKSTAFIMLTVIVVPLLLAALVNAAFILVTGSERRTQAWEQPARFENYVLSIGGILFVIALVWFAAVAGHRLIAVSS